MNVPQPGGRPPDPDLFAARQRLAALIGRLLARRWLRDRRRSVGSDPTPSIRPTVEPLRRSPNAG